MKKGADYVLSVKGNQPTLTANIREYFDEFLAETIQLHTLEKRHGRIETREYFLETDMERLVGRADWTELNAMGAVRSKAVRRHWGIDNNLHWRLDAAFKEDSSRVGKDNAPLNPNVTRKTALPLLKSANLERIGIKKKMFRAALPVDSPRFISTGKK